ncbi:hypothetical protein N7490_007418 [Penicillium lividum]|nr:hypothetical protein N7490_007418 [Penicillium lividum]
MSEVNPLPSWLNDTITTKTLYSVQKQFSPTGDSVGDFLEVAGSIRSNPTSYLTGCASRDG